MGYVCHPQDPVDIKLQEAKVLYEEGEFLRFSILPEADPCPLKIGRQAPLAEKEGKSMWIFDG